MDLRRAVFIAACLTVIAAGSAAAQAPWPQQQQPAAAPWPDQPPAAGAPWPQQMPQQQMMMAPPQQQQEPPPCAKEFFKLRDDAEIKAKAIQQASQRKASPVEACRLFNNFVAAETKMIKYAIANAKTCSIPAEVIQSMNKGHARSTEIRAKVCQAAARPQQPAAPSLSDALNAPIADSNNIKTGRGTFDTLTGTPLGGK